MVRLEVTVRVYGFRSAVRIKLKGEMFRVEGFSFWGFYGPRQYVGPLKVRSERGHRICRV